MYKVVKDFTDATDKHIYLVGDKYPRKGVKPSEDRIKELSTAANRRGEILIEEIAKPKKKAKAKKDKE